MGNEAVKILKIMEQSGSNFLDLKFTDVPGTWQHLTLPVSEVNDDLFVLGTGFHGSSIRGFQVINESDMLLLPDGDTGRVDPFYLTR